jgi:hypothetical protein
MAYLQKGYLCVWNGNGKVRPAAARTTRCTA